MPLRGARLSHRYPRNDKRTWRSGLSLLVSTKLRKDNPQLSRGASHDRRAAHAGGMTQAVTDADG